MSATDDAHRRIEAVWRIEAPRLIAGLARMVRDFGLAEEMAQDALLAALETWPTMVYPTTRCLADGDREAARHRPPAPRHAGRAQARADRP